MHFRVLMALFAAFIAATSLPSRAVAWGEKGHAVVGQVGDAFLDSNARTEIEALLEGHQFKSLSDPRLPNWADAIRNVKFYQKKFPPMKDWHFIDVDVKADLATLKLADFCKGDDCALGAIRRFQKVLQAPEADIRDRRRRCSLSFTLSATSTSHCTARPRMTGAANGSCPSSRRFACRQFTPCLGHGPGRRRRAKIECLGLRKPSSKLGWTTAA